MYRVEGVESRLGVTAPVSVRAEEGVGLGGEGVGVVVELSSVLCVVTPVPLVLPLPRPAAAGKVGESCAVRVAGRAVPVLSCWGE